MAGVGRLATREIIERTLIPEAGFTGGQSTGGAFSGIEETESGTRTLESAYELMLDEAVDGGEEVISGILVAVTSSEGGSSGSGRCRGSTLSAKRREIRGRRCDP